MKFGWKRSLDRRLRDHRPAPSDDLTQRIVSEMTPATQPRRRMRLGLAAAASAVLAIGLASTGGIGYAASAVSAAPDALKQLVTPTTNSGAEGKDDKVSICHIPPGNPANAHLITISSSAVPAHLAHGDPAPGTPCPPPGPPDDQYKDKVLVCHVPPGNPANKHEIFVSPSAVPAHLAHGDNLGPCT